MRGTVEVSSFETELLWQHWWLFLAVGSDCPDPAPSDPMPGLGRRAAAEPKSFFNFSQSGLWIQAVGTLAHTGPQGASWGVGEEGSWVLTFLFFLSTEM